MKQNYILKSILGDYLGHDLATVGVKHQSINQSINHGNDLIFVGFTLTSIFFGPSRFPHKDTVRDVIIYESPHDLLILWKYMISHLNVFSCSLILSF